MLWLVPSVALATPPASMTTHIAEMAAASAEMKDATYTLQRTERIDGRQLDTETIAVRYRRPEEVWLEWADVYPGRKVLYRDGWNHDKLRVRAFSFTPLLNLSPSGVIAMRDSRHPVWMSAIPRIVERIVGVMELLEGDASLVATFTDEGESVEGGVPSHCYGGVLPYDRDARMYAPKVRFCGGLESRMPTRFSAWHVEDGALQKVEDYVFRDLVVNPGLSDGDFDPKRL